MNHIYGPVLMRYGVATVVFGLYALISAWVIRGEGEAYRKAIQQDSLSLKAEMVPVPAPSIKSFSPEVEPPRSTSKEAPITKTNQSIAPAQNLAPIPAGPTQDRVPTPAADRITPKSPDEAPAKGPASLLDPFWEAPEQKKVWDLGNLSVADEARLGVELNRMILKFHKPLEDGPLPKRLEDAAEHYLASCTRKGISYTFTVLDCDESNAFSHPGGYVYICRGLLDWIAEEEDYALEFIVAHEMAHVDLRHALNCLQDPEVKKLKYGTLPLFYSLVIPWGYKPEQDVEADRWAALRMRKADRSRHDTLAFLRKLEDYARKNGFENVRKKPGDDPGLSPLDNHLRAHPIPRRRIKDLGTYLDPSAKTK